MNQAKLESYRRQLEQMIDRVRADASSVAEDALAPAGGQANGELSNAPMHLADSGTDAFHQEMSELLLENEYFLLNEAVEAVQRINEGQFGLCEGCGQKIPDVRLDAIPYARNCIKCAESGEDEQVLNLNTGRPSDETETIAGANKMIVRREDSLDDVLSTRKRDEVAQDRHAAGTPGGGTAVGGLGGTNIGSGNPEGVDLEEAMGSGLEDHDQADEDALIPEANRRGTAVASNSSGKRSGQRQPLPRRKEISN